jgi:hypothetical protein
VIFIFQSTEKQKSIQPRPVLSRSFAIFASEISGYLQQ